jgi:Tfp pilus assembly protein PilX
MKSLSNSKHFPPKGLQQQRGLTLISWVFVLAILAFCGMFAFAVVPMYAENRYVEQALKSLVEPGERVTEMTDAEIKKKLQNFYLVNNVRSDGPQNIVIDRKSKNLLIAIDYENRTNLFWNIDIVTSFQNHLDGEHPNLCCKPVAEARATKY